MSAPIRIAVWGAGRVAEGRHVPILRRHPDFQFMGAFGRQEGVAWLEEVQAVVIAAPPAAHAELAKTALSRGKHVLVEKPFAMTVDEGEKMAAAAKSQGRVLGVVHNFLFCRAMKKLEADLSRGRLGRVRRVAIAQFGNPQRKLPEWVENLPLKAFYDESPHHFYLLRKLAGGALRLQQAYGEKEGDGVSSLFLNYHSEAGTRATLSCQFDSALSEWHVLVTGEDALGVLDLYRDIYIRLPNDGAHKTPDVLRTSAWAIAQHAWQHAPNGLAFLRGRMSYGADEVLARFARAIQGDAAALEGLRAEDALGVLRLQHEAVHALTGNRLS